MGSEVCPAEWSSYELRAAYRCTGQFASPEAAFVALVNVQNSGEAIACKLTIASRQHIDRSNRIVVEHVKPDGAAKCLAEADGKGDWFDDGCEHEVVVRSARGQVSLAIDGVPQLRVKTPLRSSGIGFGANAASVAVYHLLVGPIQA